MKFKTTIAATLTAGVIALASFGCGQDADHYRAGTERIIVEATIAAPTPTPYPTAVPTYTPVPTFTPEPTTTPNPTTQAKIDALKEEHHITTAKTELAESKIALEEANNVVKRLLAEGKYSEVELQEANNALDAAIRAAKLEEQSDEIVSLLLDAQERHAQADKRRAEMEADRLQQERDKVRVDSIAECQNRITESMSNKLTDDQILKNLTCVQDLNLTPLPTRTPLPPTPTPTPDPGEVADITGDAKRYSTRADFAVYRDIGSFTHDDADYIQTQLQRPIAVVKAGPLPKSVCVDFRVNDVLDKNSRDSNDAVPTNPHVKVFQNTRELSHVVVNQPYSGDISQGRSADFQMKLNAGSDIYYFVMWSANPKEQPSGWWYKQEQRHTFADVYWTAKFMEHTNPVTGASLC